MPARERESRRPGQPLCSTLHSLPGSITPIPSRTTSLSRWGVSICNTWKVSRQLTCIKRGKSHVAIGTWWHLSPNSPGSHRDGGDVVDHRGVSCSNVFDPCPMRRVWRGVLTCSCLLRSNPGDLLPQLPRPRRSGDASLRARLGS